MPTKNEVLEKIKSSGCTSIKVAVTDIDGVLRGKIIHVSKFLSAVEKGSGFCEVIFGWDINDEAYDNVEVTGWHTGYPDTDFQIDLTTFRNIPWEQNMPFFLGDFSKTGHTACPRTLLKKVIQKAEDMGFRPVFAQEFEWFNFEETAQSLDQKSFVSPTPITPGMFGYSMLRTSQKSVFCQELFHQLEEFDCTIEGLHTETGPGVYEACIRYDDALAAADKAVLFKTAVKEIAYKHGIMPTFMAKWNHQLPGSSGHLHQSLWAGDSNAFADSLTHDGLSAVMRQYIAGQLAALPHILPMYAPTINSYKRLVEGAWAPTSLNWGIDNRTVALRILNPDEKGTRIETRVPGADVNPYLAMAAALASGLYGIEHQLELNIPKETGNGYANTQAKKLPNSLESATKAMKGSAIANELFGEAFTRHFCLTREWETRQFASKVTDWELKRYFESI